VERRASANLETFTVEHELPAQIGLRLSYIGTYGGNLEQQFSIDPQEPKYSYAKRTGLQPAGQSNLLRAVPQWGLIGHKTIRDFPTTIQRRLKSGGNLPMG